MENRSLLVTSILLTEDLEVHYVSVVSGFIRSLTGVECCVGELGFIYIKRSITKNLDAKLLAI